MERNYKLLSLLMVKFFAQHSIASSACERSTNAAAFGEKSAKPTVW